MSDQYHFDSLGNPRYRPAKPDWQHRAIRVASIVTGVICLGIMLWGR